MLLEECSAYRTDLLMPCFRDFLIFAAKCACALQPVCQLATQHRSFTLRTSRSVDAAIEAC